ncbi:MAG: addiction module protein [Cyclobacteriaceae bacterium]
MSTTEIRQKLFDYIRMADDKKVKAIYTILSNEIQEETDIWTDEFLQELNKRTAEFESGKAKGLTWKEIKSRGRPVTLMGI